MHNTNISLVLTKVTRDHITYVMSLNGVSPVIEVNLFSYKSNRVKLVNGDSPAMDAI
jgi:hypothetical protein